MALIKKNIWLLFYIILGISIFLFSILSYSQWYEVNKDFQAQNENFSKVIAKSTTNYFKQIDMLLEILGQQLLENENYKNVRKTKKLFQNMLDSNASIIAYALIDPKGNFLITQLDTAVENITNVLERPEAKDSFLEGLKTKNIIVGRTYLLNNTKKLAIPVRKTFFDENKNPIAVISIAIDANNTHLFDKDLLHSDANIIHLLRAKDLYRQLYIYVNKNKQNNDIYNKPLPKDAYDIVMKRLEKKYDLSIGKIKLQEIPVSFKYQNSIDKKDYLISLTYINEHHLWAASYLNTNVIHSKFLYVLLLYAIVFISLILIIWWLFKYISNIEEDRRKSLEYKAMHDFLTQLPNRYYLKSKSYEWTNQHKSYSIIYMDLDNFKTINDTHGHELGDKVLRLVVSRLKNTIEKNDLLIRHSGDEFIIFTSVVKNIESYCKNVIKSFEKEFKVHHKKFHLTASLGIGIFPKDTSSVDDLIRKADVACYKAKENKNSYILFNENIAEKHIEKMLIEEELKTAIEKNEFYLVYQPQINYDNSLHGVESLIRWNNKKLGLVPPDKFISIAEDLGMMPQLGEFILETALKEITVFKKQLQIDLQLSINISVKQFMHKNFYESLMTKIKEYQVDPNHIALEITESVFSDNIEYLVSLLNNLRHEGFTISMDDFGTGYSSLSMLRKFPINELKIDKSFVDDITFNKSAKNMAATIISIGKILDCDIVLAEGVETKEQLDLLHELGCDIYQGYYYSKPLELKDLANFILKS